MGIGNMTILRTEARHLVAFMLSDESVDRLHLLCPDPWPKGRHSGHRLLTSDFVSQLHRVLKKDGIFHFSSDDEPYYTAVRGVLASSGLFVEAPEAIADLAGIRSDFEQRWNDEGKPGASYRLSAHSAPGAHDRPLTAAGGEEAFSLLFLPPGCCNFGENGL